MSDQRERHYLEAELFELFSADPRIFEFIKDGSLDGVWFWDLEQPEHEWISERFWLTLGVDPAAKQHRSDEWRQIIHEDDLVVADENFRRHCADQAHPFDQYVRYRHAQGHWVTVRCRGLAIRNAAGKPIRMLGANTDVSEIVAAKEHNEALLAELEQQNDDLLAFAYAASHDLRSPLNSMKGLFTLLREDLAEITDDDGRELMDRIDLTITRMQSLVDSVLKIASMTNHGIERRDVDVNALVDDVMRDREAVIESGRCTLDIDDLGRARIDPSLAAHALGNLVDNALKYRSPERDLHVSITADRDNDALTLHVADNGVGFSPGQVQNAFKFFTRRSSIINAQSSGLGLAIVRKVAELHGGSVEAESLNDGARVSIRFADAL